MKPYTYDQLTLFLENPNQIELAVCGLVILFFNTIKKTSHLKAVIENEWQDETGKVLSDSEWALINSPTLIDFFQTKPKDSIWEQNEGELARPANLYSQTMVKSIVVKDGHTGYKFQRRFQAQKSLRSQNPNFTLKNSEKPAAGIASLYRHCHNKNPSITPILGWYPEFIETPTETASFYRLEECHDLKLEASSRYKQHRVCILMYGAPEQRTQPQKQGDGLYLYSFSKHIIRKWELILIKDKECVLILTKQPVPRLKKWQKELLEDAMKYNN